MVLFVVDGICLLCRGEHSVLLLALIEAAVVVFSVPFLSLTWHLLILLR